MCSVTLHCQVPEAFRRTRAGGRCDAATVPICTDVYPPSRALYAAGSDAGAAAAALLPFLATTVDGSLMRELAARAFAKRMYGDGTPACAGANGSVTCQTAVPLAAVPGMIIASTPGENLAAVPCPTGSYADPAPFESWCGDMTPSILWVNIVPIPISHADLFIVSNPFSCHPMSSLHVLGMLSATTLQQLGC